MIEPRGQPTDRELAEQLLDIGRRIEHPPTPDLGTAVRRRIAAEQARRAAAAHGLAHDAEQPKSAGAAWTRGPRRRPAWLLVPAVLAILAFAAILASPAARSMLADRLGLPGIAIRFVEPGAVPTPAPTPAPPPGSTPGQTLRPDLGRGLDLGERTTLTDAEATVAFPVLRPDPAAWGEPDAVYLDPRVAGGAISLVYRPRPGLPPTAETGVGLLVTQFAADLRQVSYGKEILHEQQIEAAKGIGPGTRIEAVTVDDHAGYWVEGAPHPFIQYVDADGNEHMDSIRLAGNTLLWSGDGRTVRLESALDRQAAIKIAEGMR